jgi:serine/threonine protein kinase/tetratricopeptide (TPR) repeat protein
MDNHPDLTQSTVAIGEPSPSLPKLPPGSRVGRYVLLVELGKGGMGVVYKAYDPELERPVALKLLRASGEGEAAARFRERLLREAQALAQLSHPNVVAVHDVGTFGEGVFIAMEFVEGQTVTKWAAEKTRSIDEILAIFLAAGEGLAAAHRATLVHRDFKPDNVIVGSDGRVRVLDFGLARIASLDEAPGEAVVSISDKALADSTLAGTTANQGPPDSPLPRAAATGAAGRLPSLAELSQGAQSLAESGGKGLRSPGLLGSPLTRVGTVLGTPRFMAPEQHLSQVVTDRADQFSFCVSLYLVLYGDFPHLASSPDELKERVVNGQIENPPARTRVRSWLRHVLLRGLQPKPEDRYPSMAALLEALRKDPRIARSKQLRIAGAVAFAVVAAIAWRLQQRQLLQACKGAERNLVGVWDEARKREVHEKFQATRLPHAQHVFATVAAALDRYAQAWTTMRVDACEATRVRGEQSEELLDLRMECLAQRLGDLKARAELFSAPDAKVVENAVQAAQSLPPLDGCADAAALRAPVRPPADPQLRRRVADVRSRIARAAALDDAGKYEEGLRTASEAVTVADTLHYDPVAAEARLRLGTLQHDSGDFRAELETGRRAMLDAIAGGSSESAMLATSELIRAGTESGRYEDAHRWAELALAFRKRVPNAEHARILVESDLMRLDWREGKLDDALAKGQELIDLIRKYKESDEFLLAKVYNERGAVQKSKGDWEGALDSHRRALAIYERLVGPDHPQTAGIHNNIGTAFGVGGRHDDAVREFGRVLAIYKVALRPDHPRVARVYTNLGVELRAKGDLEAAFANEQRALEIWERSLGPTHPYVAYPLTNMADIELERGHPEDALRDYQRALTVRGSEHPEAAYMFDGIGSCYRLLGERDQALAMFYKALAHAEKGFSPTHELVARILTDMAWLALDQRTPERAIALLDRALAIVAHGVHDDPLVLPDAQLLLAKALWRTRGDAVRATELATRARDNYAVVHRATRAHEASVWLAKSQ